MTLNLSLLLEPANTSFGNGLNTVEAKEIALNMTSMNTVLI